MKITNVTGVASGQGITTGPSAGKLADPAGSDVSWFSAAMQDGGDQAPMTLESASRPFNELFQSLQGKSDIAARRLKKAAASVDPKDIRQANKSLSSFYLESMLSAKLVGKAAQSVEKLTNLQ
ncbi:type III secretion system inner rod subunit SctI [Pseudomonas indica]|uniref:type III secretion system inner rod subunit SctI n=1 Tax=Pseudomonas indica TaxID=137658 RepID=UPI0023F6456B|nr:type III secretion system inner rod subunit SctI [Pseudomonas indica]MBU3057501.1 type III secretion system inner rod subunit SctI [Pseudomonas indica]